MAETPEKKCSHKVGLPRSKEQISMSAAPSGKIAGKKHPGKAILAGKLWWLQITFLNDCK